MIHGAWWSKEQETQFLRDVHGCYARKVLIESLLPGFWNSWNGNWCRWTEPGRKRTGVRQARTFWNQQSLTVNLETRDSVQLDVRVSSGLCSVLFSSVFVVVFREKNRRRTRYCLKQLQFHKHTVCASQHFSPPPSNIPFSPGDIFCSEGTRPGEAGHGWGSCPMTLVSLLKRSVTFLDLGASWVLCSMCLCASTS